MSEEERRTEEPPKETPEKEPKETKEPKEPKEPKEAEEGEEGKKKDEPAAPVAKSEEKKDTDHINLKVVGQDGAEVFFKIKKHTSLKRLIDAYCQRQGVSSTAIRFLFDGRRIQPDQTPKDLGMEDGDIIDAMLFQTGGF